MPMMIMMMMMMMCVCVCDALCLICLGLVDDVAYPDACEEVSPISLVLCVSGPFCENNKYEVYIIYAAHV